jgi:hypothetical protein
MSFNLQVTKLSSSLAHGYKIESYWGQHFPITVPPYPQVIRSETYCGYVKPRIKLNAIHNFVTYINAVKFN